MAAPATPPFPGGPRVSRVPVDDRSYLGAIVKEPVDGPFIADEIVLNAGFLGEVITKRCGNADGRHGAVSRAPIEVMAPASCLPGLDLRPWPRFFHCSDLYGGQGVTLMSQVGEHGSVSRCQVVF